MPHAGCPHPHLRDVYDQLRFALAESQQLGCKVIVGCDFTTQQHVGIRGLMFADLLHQFPHVLANHEHKCFAAPAGCDERTVLTFLVLFCNVTPVSSVARGGAVPGTAVWDGV